MPPIRIVLAGLAASVAVACSGVAEPPGEQPPPSTPPPAQGTALEIIQQVFAEDFESGSFGVWQDRGNPERHAIISDPAFARSGSRYLQITVPAGSDGGWLNRFFMPGHDSIYISMWVRFDTNWQGGTKLMGFYGSRTDNQWSALGQAGRCPTGSDFFTALLVTSGAGNPGRAAYYTYHPDMPRTGTTCWGDSGAGRALLPAAVPLEPGRWQRLEYWVKLNTPGQSNGHHRFWVDGQLQGDWSGLRFRTTSDLRLNVFQLAPNAVAPQAQRMYVDDIIIGVPRRL